MEPLIVNDTSHRFLSNFYWQTFMKKEENQSEQDVLFNDTCFQSAL